MNYTISYYRMALILMSVITATISAEPTVLYGNSFLSPRSQNTNAPRYLVGSHRFTYRPDHCFHTFVSVTGQYGKSYRPYRIAEYFFGTDTLMVSGSQVPDRDPQAILADYFGLSPEFSSVVKLEPHIRNALVDFAWFAEYHRWYGYIRSPYVWCKTNFKLFEATRVDDLEIPFPPLYMDVPAVPPAAFTFTRAIQGGLSFGQVQPLEFGKIVCEQKRDGFADVLFVSGYNFVQDELGHFGLNLRVTAPTGNRSRAEFLLEPMLGNGHHWEAGMGASGHWVFWEKDADQYAAFYLEANFTHLFPSIQRRSFDFGTPNFLVPDFKLGSRYILVKEFDADGNYTGVTLPAINITTLCARSEYALEFDMALMFGYVGPSFSLDLGYGAWARSHEKLCLLEGIEPYRYGLKGIQNVAGPGINNTQSTATLFGNPFDEQAEVADDPSPVFIGTHNLNIASAAAPPAFTQKFFWFLSWTRPPFGYCGKVAGAPFFGFGGFIEFEGLNPRSLTEPNQNSVSQWAFWIKTGIAF